MIVVTGAAGFIGRNLTQALLARGHDDVVAVDLDSALERIEGLAVREIVGAQALFERLERGDVELVFHQGACSDTMEEDWSLVMRRNWQYSRLLLGICTSLGVRLVYASSAAVYGKGEAGFAEDPACEAPLNVYGLSKLLFDHDVRLDSESRNHQVVGLRYFNVYGPGEIHKGPMASMVHRLVAQATTTGRMRLFEGSDRFSRDFVSVEDVVRVNLFFLERPEISGLFNVGTGRELSFLRLAERILERYSRARLEWIPFPEFLRSRYQA